MNRTAFSALMGLVVFTIAGQAAAQEPSLVEAIRRIDPRVLEATGDDPREAVRRDVRERLRAANRRETEAWRQLKSKEDWEHYRDERLAALRRSLGTLPEPGQPVTLRVTKRIDGDGFVIENVLFESRPGITVTANLYRPAKPSSAMPGIILCHAHHAPKTQGELQTMGMTWARQGCLVLVMDQLGHGERRTHGFATADSYQGSFRPERQDYYFRYNTAAQLHLAGESLIGWMVGDMMRGVDLLLQQPGIDAEKIILLGAVAGGGDPAAVTAALDKRIAAVVPFNFGGSQPETVYPLPADSEESFNYAGSGSWESTRNLRLSARDGFLPWVIVGAMAPRRLIYAHEFLWDRERDPVWKRLQQIYAWYDVPDRLSSVAGRGSVRGKSPEATHCTNIGAVHRAQIYPAFERWFSMPIPAQEYTERLPSEELMCLTKDVTLQPLHEVLSQRVPNRVGSAEDAKQQLAEMLGGVSPESQVAVASQRTTAEGALVVERVHLNQPSGDVVIPIPLLLVRSSGQDKPPVRIVVGVAQAGKAEFLRQRAEEIAALVEAGAWVLLPDLRGTGETLPEGEGRGRTSGATSRSATEWMLGQTVLGQRVRDLRAVIAYARLRVPKSRFTLWGEGFVPPNSEGTKPVPYDADKQPAGSEPLGALVARLAALWEDDVDTVYVTGSTTSYRALLASPYFYVPQDVLIPGVLTTCDLNDLQARIAPRRILWDETRDAWNRPSQSSERPTGPKLTRMLLGK